MTKTLFNFRVERKDLERLKVQALAEGYSTLSSYIRSRLFGLSTDLKLNKILEILKNGQKT